MTTRHATLGVLLLGCIIGACGSGNKGSASDLTVSGIMNNVAFKAKSGAFDNIGQSILLVALVDAGDICSLADGTSAMPDSLIWLNVDLCTTGSNPVGDYTVQTGSPSTPCDRGVAWATIRQLSSSGQALETPVNGGAVSITASSEVTLDGTLNVQLADGTTTQGNFAVSYCSALNK